MLTRPIPSSGEPLPVIGLGTWQAFDVGGGGAERAPLADVLATLFGAGGSMIDSSPMYGRAETVVGDLLGAARARDKAFVATKVWTSGRAAGIEQMRRSAERMQAPQIDLMQIHNLLDWRTHLPVLRAWKAEGRIRYLGITHYTPSAHADLAAVMRAETLDFVQLDYALDDRAAERELLPLAAERGVAILVNKPLGSGSLLRRLRGRPLPGFAAELGCTSWAQLCLKFILAHPAVTCIIPATSIPAHMAENAAAGQGPLPDATLRAKIASALDRS